MSKVKNHNSTMLMELLRFNSEELVANRDGYLSEKQLRYLRDRAGSWRFNRWLLMAGSGIGLIVTFLDFQSNGNIADHICFMGLICVATVFGIGYAYSQEKRFKADIAGQPAVVEGKIGLISVIEGKNPSRRHYLLIQGLKFNVTWNVSEALEQNGWYRIYYAPHSNIILSIKGQSD
jgi:hypothetical protein